MKAILQAREGIVPRLNSIEATALSQALSAVNALKSVARLDSAETFEHLNANSNGKIVHVTMDVTVR